MTPGFTPYAAAVLERLAATPERTVLTTADGRRITAHEFHGTTCRLAGELAARGAGRGLTVTLLTGNTPEGLSARYAASLTGARVVGLHDGMGPQAMAAVVSSAETRMLLVDAGRQEAARRLLPLVDVPAVLGLGPGPAGPDVLAASARQPAGIPDVRIGPDDDLAIRHTGGTTGVPKGILSLHGPYRRALDSPLAEDGPSRFLACTPLAHLAGFYADLHLYRGGSVVLRNGFEAGDVLAAVARERITHTWLLPPLLHQLLDHPALAGTDVSSLRRILYGGCTASASRLREALEVFGPVLTGGYGQSEAQSITALAPHEHTHTGAGGRITVGRALPGVEIAIRDPAGQDLPTGREGEIQVRSAGVMRGYWKQPELTARVLRDGWLRTGDVGYLDEDGYLYLVDRLSDVIIVPGGHVYPSEVEEVLLAHPAVAQCAVFGARDADETEHVHAAVVLAPGGRPGPAELRRFVAERTGAVHAPEFLHAVPRLPLTPAGKPDRNRLRERLAGGTAAG
ncbi:AMP-binding protein [Streptomyces sp. NPDC101118]|uniref:AMP-binding protein n=1 Tax=Streptomyces sp. NPDC101118 TaxID=3366109 RepID=UPI0037F31B5F